ncbi:hypothetical protein L7F22_063532 [Adiantum nelumboides]|nr:hypothetical protein [Adiantum nelumboides]
MAPKKSTKGGKNSNSTPPSRRNTRSSDAMPEPLPPTQTELQEVEAPLDNVKEQEIRAPPPTTDTANTIYTDSQSALAVGRNPFFHAGTKHIEVHHHYVKERLSTGEISLAYVPTQNNLADFFTKALFREMLEAFRKALGLLSFVD